MEIPAKTLKMKKMFAVVQAIYDREDLEDSEVKIIGVYSSKENAKKACDEAKKSFLDDIMCDGDEDPEDMLDNDYDRYYDWHVSEVKVEA